MNKDYISTEQFASLLTEIHQKLEMGKVAECDDMLRQILSDTQSQESYIDRTYRQSEGKEADIQDGGYQPYADRDVPGAD